MKPVFFIALLSLVSFSCEKEIPLNEDEIEPRIVVNGTFSAGDSIRIHLSESRNVLYEGVLPDLTGANAKLYDGNDNFLGDFIYEGYGYYKLPDYLPVSGTDYKLVVSSTGFKEVTARTNTPSIISVSSVDTIRQGEEMNYKLKFNDDPTQTNYYAVMIESISYYTDEFGGIMAYSDFFFETSEIYTQNGSADVDGSKYGTIFLFSDATFSGGQCSFTATTFVPDVPDDSVAAVINLLSLSEDYFKYHVSLDKYHATAGDPFAQPVQVYSNVDQGFGIFGAYSGYRDTLWIEQ